jgi:general secretion pathway protein H
MTVSDTRAASGFTLLEMLVVIGIMGLLAGLVFPAIAQGISRTEFRVAAAEVEGRIRSARAVAIGRGLTVPVTILTGGEDMRRVIGGPFRLPKRMQLQLPRNDLRFFKDGTSTGGNVVLSDGKHVFHLHIDADTGAIGIVQ